MNNCNEQFWNMTVDCVCVQTFEFHNDAPQDSGNGTHVNNLFLAWPSFSSPSHYLSSLTIHSRYSSSLASSWSSAGIPTLHSLCFLTPMSCDEQIGNFKCSLQPCSKNPRAGVHQIIATANTYLDSDYVPGTLKCVFPP